MSHFITCWCLFGIGAPLATAEVALRFAHDSTSADLELGSKKTGCMITTESFKIDLPSSWRHRFFAGGHTKRDEVHD